jgi:hypothetical protein
MLNLRCPVCRDPNLDVTTIGTLGIVDMTNRATCNTCGWRGLRVIAEVVTMRAELESARDVAITLSQVTPTR